MGNSCSRSLKYLYIEWVKGCFSDCYSVWQNRLSSLLTSAFALAFGPIFFAQKIFPSKAVVWPWQNVRTWCCRESSLVPRLAQHQWCYVAWQSMNHGKGFSLNEFCQTSVKVNPSLCKPNICTWHKYFQNNILFHFTLKKKRKKKRELSKEWEFSQNTTGQVR